MRRALIHSSLIALLSSAAANVALANGTAADLDGIEPIGWPLGVPMSCGKISSVIEESLKESVLKLREYCKEQNAKMQEQGYATCAENQCLDGALTTANGKDYGSVRLRLGRSQYTNAYYANLVYTFPVITGKVRGSALRCFDPAERAEELLRAELETWDFQRFVEFCVKRP
ncbi:MAG: hypothetical protein FJY29_07280 [Betaproteobacteria bacterium]|nr:hypothetical protein [Betaproteobacteria bacterium]